MPLTNDIVDAVLDNDPSKVKQLLKSDPSLATGAFQTPKLYDAKIFHWIYTGDTLLHLAAAGYRVEIVRLLLESGADPNAANNHRRSNPLHYAVDGFLTGPTWDPKRQVETIKELINKGADINSQDKNGATPLHRAVRTRCAAAVKFLLDAGANPTIKNKPGSTPFHLAVQNTGRGGSGEQIAIDGQREIIKEFLERGISTNLRDGKGKTVAGSVRSEWIQQLLSSHT
ncbi:MAG TPA: ankyrin repeat domain-containing protein [Pyrinomonadaceae bacterium]